MPSAFHIYPSQIKPFESTCLTLPVQSSALWPLGHSRPTRTATQTRLADHEHSHDQKHPSSLRPLL